MAIAFQKGKLVWDYLLDCEDLLKTWNVSYCGYYKTIDILLYSYRHKSSNTSKREIKHHNLRKMGVYLI